MVSSATGSVSRATSRTDFDVLGRPVAVYAANPQGSQSAVSFAGFGNTQTTARASRTTYCYSGLNSNEISEDLFGGHRLAVHEAPYGIVQRGLRQVRIVRHTSSGGSL